MTRNEAIKKLATEVMGCNWYDDPYGKAYDGELPFAFERRDGVIMLVGSDCCDKSFNPYVYSADNDALIEAFVGKYENYHINISIINDSVLVVSNQGNGKMYGHPIGDGYTTAKKNESVCEAILKAIGKEAGR